MRRDRSAQPGLNDFLIVEAITAAPAPGVKRISLNFAVFRSALERGERIGAGPVLRAWRSVLLFLSRWYQIQSLYKFNAKYCPVWQPRFFVFPGGRDAPRITLAALQAESFLTWPKLEAGRYARNIVRRLGDAGPPHRAWRNMMRGQQPSDAPEQAIRDARRALRMICPATRIRRARPNSNSIRPFTTESHNAARQGPGALSPAG